MSSTAQRATLSPDMDSETGAVAVLSVLAGGESYGFPLSAVREILVPPPLTGVPRAPKHFLGVIVVRGQIISVIDLPKMLHLEPTERDEWGCILLVDNGDELIGVAVDRVIQVHRLEPNEIEYTNAISAELSDYVIGVGRVPPSSSTELEEMLILIDPASLLGD
ncbi:MAG: chemotaxis protein CheW [Myxococcales bacterium]|nr:MAG: chemotaxis protein CheW [Myxococcales bacterium]